METMNPVQPQNNPVDPMDKVSPVTPAEDTNPTPTPQAAPPSGTPPMNSNEQNVNKPKSKGPLIALLGILTLLILLIGAGAFLALVAYGKVDINNRELERKISFAIQDLPYTPKTAEYLIYKSFEKQSDLKSLYVDASIALEGSEAMSITGIGNTFDLVINGPIDFHDPESPEVEINVKMTPELDADFVTVNDKVFFRINEIPAIVKGFASGADFPLDLFLNKWISYDLKTLESDAKSALNEDKGNRDEEDLAKVKTAILNSDVLDMIKVTETEVNGVSAYQMELSMTNDEYIDFVDEISKAVDPDSYSRQLSQSGSTQIFDNLKITIFIDKKDMNTVRSMISFRLKSGGLAMPTQVLGASTIEYFPSTLTAAVDPKDQYVDVAIVINGSRFDEDFEIDEPSGATPFETIIEEYTRQMMQKESMLMGGTDYDSEGFGEIVPSPYELPEEEDSGISPY